MNSLKKFLAVFLSVLMIFMLSAPAYASEGSEGDSSSAQTMEPAESSGKNETKKETEKETVKETETKKESEAQTEPSTEESQEQSGSDFSWEKAASIAVTAAKSKMILEGLTTEITDKAAVTRITYDKDAGTYKAVIRSQFKHKYICKIATSEVLGKTIGYLADSEYQEQNVVRGFFGWLFEKIAFFFIKLFGMLD